MGGRLELAFDHYVLGKGLGFPTPQQPIVGEMAASQLPGRLNGGVADAISARIIAKVTSGINCSKGSLTASAPNPSQAGP